MKEGGREGGRAGGRVGGWVGGRADGWEFGVTLECKQHSASDDSAWDSVPSKCGIGCHTAREGSYGAERQHPICIQSASDKHGPEAKVEHSDTHPTSSHLVIYPRFY